MAKKKPPTQHAVRCYHCGHEHVVAGRATRVSCPKCAKSLCVENVTIKNTEGWSHFQTCGKVTILTKGKLVAQTVHAQNGVEVRGGLEAKTYTGGPVVLKKNAVWKSDCAATSVTIEEGATIHRSLFNIRQTPAPDTEAGRTETIV